MNILKLNDGSKPVADAANPKASSNELEEKIIDILRTVYDPEIPVNIYEMGLVYGIKIDSGANVVVRMTLTSPGCPVVGSLPPEVEAKVLSVPGVSSARVELVWDPPWKPDMMSDAARLQLGFY
jgi:FeS assembly SUF system protein